MRLLASLLLVALAVFVGCGREGSQHVTSDGMLIVDPDGFESAYAVAMRDEDYERAESLARDWVRISPDTTDSWLALTYPLLMTERFEAAIESCEKALSIAPDDKRLLYTRGLIEQQQGDACLDDEAYDAAHEHFSSAVGFYTRAIELDSEFPDTLKLTKPATTIVPAVSDNVAVYFMDGRVHAFSGETGQWDSIDSTVPPQIMRNGTALIVSTDWIGTFSPRAGKWSVAELTE